MWGRTSSRCELKFTRQGTARFAGVESADVTAHGCTPPARDQGYCLLGSRAESWAKN